MIDSFKIFSSQTAIAGTAIVFIIFNIALPLNSPLQTEVTEYPFKLTINLEKTTYKLKEGIKTTLYLQNIGTESVIFYYPFEFDLFVYDENFIRIFEFSDNVGTIAVIYPPEEMPPGRIINATDLAWWQEVKPYYIYEGLGIPLTYFTAKPGTYFVTGVFYPQGLPPPSIETPPIRIVIAED